ncbi:MAG: hypothetical protein EXS17_02625 [Phycisphaerales bacterium]|nr:hypothetical protein [Phycisphaerales bacterium]
MDMKEIKKLNDEELGLESGRVRRSIFNLHSQVVTEKVKDSSQFGKLHGDLARLLTEVSARRVAKNPVVRKAVAVAQTKTVSKPAGKKAAAKKVKS